MRKKAQSQIEYITTYVWAFVIIVVALAALYELGIFRTTYLPDTCISRPGFLCTGVSLSSTGLLRFTFSQSTGGEINLTSVGCAAGSSANDSEFTTANMLLKSGQTTNLTAQCPVTSSALGTKFDGVLSITYDQGKGVEYSTNIGTVTATVETYSPPIRNYEVVSSSASQSLQSGYSISLPGEATQGDDLVVVFSATSTSVGCPTVTLSDTQGNSWSSITSKCQKAASGNEWAFSQIFYAIAKSTAGDSVTARTSGGSITAASGLIAFYDITPGATAVVSATPGSGTTYTSTYTTQPLYYTANAVLIEGTNENDGGACCTAGSGFSIYSTDSGSGSEYSNTVASPSSFPVSSGGGSGTVWVDVGAAFEPS